MVADRIRFLREQLEFTQTDLAKKLGISRSSVNAWELGISTPSTQYIVELADLFSVSTDYLLGVNDSATVSVKGLNEKDISLVCSLVNHLRNKNSKSYDSF